MRAPWWLPDALLLLPAPALLASAVFAALAGHWATAAALTGAAAWGVVLWLERP